MHSKICVSQQLKTHAVKKWSNQDFLKAQIKGCFIWVYWVFRNLQLHDFIGVIFSKL